MVSQHGPQASPTAKGWWGRCSASDGLIGSPRRWWAVIVSGWPGPKTAGSTTVSSISHARRTVSSVITNHSSSAAAHSKA